MKQFLLLSALSIATMMSAQQQITSSDYDLLKRTGQLDPAMQYIFITPGNQTVESSAARNGNPVQAQSTTCNCLIPLDTTFSVVPFQAGIPPDYRNDDASSNPISLPFSFNFYGTSYSSIFINNNGNISFGSPYTTFTATPFPTTSFSMIAPFWADVDTRAALSGLVYYKVTPTYMIVKWENVGYFSAHDSLLSTFQLIISDGIDTIVPSGSNVSFCYGDMQWTTGDASSGVNGFGGFPSTTGVNQGNGTDYFQATQSDASGMAFDGPYGSNDGVDWLDNQEIYFNTAILGNTPPLVMNSTICDTIDVYTGDTLRTMDMDSIMFDFFFMTPENNQVVTAALTSNAPAGAFSYVQTANTATYKAYACTFRAKDIPPGIYTVTGSATDNGSPAGQSSGQVVIHTYYDAALSVTEPAHENELITFPNPATDVLTIGNIPNGNAVIEIVDLFGRSVYSSTVTGKQMTVNTSAFAPGVYFINVISSTGGRQSIKFVRN